MNRPSLLRVLVLASAVLLVGAALPARAGEMTLDRALARYTAARGGLDRIRAVRSLHFHGKMTMPQGMDASLDSWWAAPNRFRVEFSFQSMKAISTFDGREGWSLVPFSGKAEPERMPPEQVEQVKAQADWRGILLQAKEKGIALEWKGPAEVDGSPAWRIDAIGRDGERTEIYLDGETFLEVRQVRHVKRGGGELSLQVDYGDYREVDGIVFPFTMRTTIPGMPGGQSVVIERIELNPDLPPDLFARPRAPRQPARNGDSGGGR